MQNGNRRVYRVRVALFLLCVLLAAVLIATIYFGIQTITRLDATERARDQWQRPSDVLEALDLKSGNTVVDLGCGSGYFALKLSAVVGTRGKVLAVDIRRVSLLAVRIRAILRGDHNIGVIHDDPDNPGLPPGPVDAVLISNAYHELRDPQSILRNVFHSLRPGGRLVVLDQGPEFNGGESREHETKRHQLALNFAASEIPQGGFEIIRQQSRFANPPGDDPWWLVVARRP